MDLAKGVYLLTQEFSDKKIIGLSSQLQRAAVSIPSNLAEGRARDSTKEFLRHVSVAQGSLAELETQLRIADFLDYGNKAKIKEMLEMCGNERRTLGGPQVSLKSKLRA